MDLTISQPTDDYPNNLISGLGQQLAERIDDGGNTSLHLLSSFYLLSVILDASNVLLHVIFTR